MSISGPLRIAGTIALVGLAASNRSEAQDAAPPSPPPSEQKPPTKQADELDVVKLDKMVVKEDARSASAAFTDKASTDTVGEVLSGSALMQPSVQNAGDALKGVSGVTVSRAADGSTNVSIRGLAPQFNRVTIDGQRQSNSGKFSTGSSLDSVPPEILKSIEVSKSLTPDMDADAIGGVINLLTANASDLKQPFEQGREQLIMNSQAPRPGDRSSFSMGRPFHLFTADSNKPNAGILVTFSYDQLYKPRQNIETFDDWPTIVSPGPAPFTGALIPSFTNVNLEDTHDYRERGALLVNTDARLGESVVYLKFNYSRDTRFRTRGQEDFNPEDGTPVSLTPNSESFSGVYLTPHGVRQNQTRELATLSVGDRTDLERIHLSGNLGYTRTEDSEPRSLDAELVSQDAYTVSTDDAENHLIPRLGFVDDTNPGATASTIANPADYNFSSLTVTHSRGIDSNFAAQGDLKIDLDDRSQPSFLKFGAKVQQARRAVDQQRQVYDPNPSGPPVSAVGLIGEPLVTDHMGGYVFGPIADPDAVANLVATQPNLFQLNATDTALGSNGASDNASQTIYAGYGMFKEIWGPWALIAGVRTEVTDFDARANQPLFASNGVLLGFTRASNSRSYVDVLPSASLRYDPQPGLIFRAGVYRSLIRPGYGDLAPYLDVNFAQFRAREGNPDLKPYEAINYDLSADWYRDSVGLLSASVFFKSIRDFQADSERTVTIGDLGTFVEYQKVNGDTAYSGGAELGWKSRTWDLPGGFGGVTVGLTETLTQSKSHVPNRPGETLPLPLQAKNQSSLNLRWERDRLSFNATVTYHTAMMDELVSTDRDRYEEGMFNVDLGLEYKVSKHLTLIAGGANLTSAASQAYSGETSRVKEWESNPYELSAGINWKL